MPYHYLTNGFTTKIQKQLERFFQIIAFHQKLLIHKRHIHKRIKFLKQKNNNDSIDNTDELNKSGEKTPTNTEDNTGESNKPVEKTTFMSLPYVNNLSENMAHSFKKFGIDVFHTLPKKLRH